jgi:hypothetical protein
MHDDSSGLPRAVELIEREFDGMLANKWEREIARERFETLWDEVNAAALGTLNTDAGNAYIALLSRMQEAFDNQYRSFPIRRGNGFSGPVA